MRNTVKGKKNNNNNNNNNNNVPAAENTEN